MAGHFGEMFALIWFIWEEECIRCGPLVPFSFLFCFVFVFVLVSFGLTVPQPSQ